ncbi:hypothetical protein MVEN_00867800 [Mycena venus]|uniref:Uncharacterized protein n=1 Tax=Mycena venus TaxID=2733690 RepID=A0A8H6YEE5_9AGAR|nr:hypothetical protein MVEN_00867800 [Mycena venus]
MSLPIGSASPSLVLSPPYVIMSTHYPGSSSATLLRDKYLLSIVIVFLFRKKLAAHHCDRHDTLTHILSRFAVPFSRADSIVCVLISRLTLPFLTVTDATDHRPP